MQYHRSPSQKWFLTLVNRSMQAQVSTRSGSKLSGEKPGSAQLDLNRQFTQTKDPQGMYVCGPDGTPYGFTNDHEPADIHHFMNTALTRYKVHPPTPTTVSPAEKNAPFSITPPAGVEIFQVYARIPHVPKTCSFLNEGIGRDFLWIYPDERTALALSATRANGKSFSLPDSLLWRIGRFHLVDDVRGTPDMWAVSAVHNLRATARSTKLPSGLLQIDWVGTFTIANKRQSYAGNLMGYLHIHPDGNTISRFRLFADGLAWGTGTFTPNSPPGKYRLAVAIVDTTNPASRIVPPEEVATANNDRRYRHPHSI